jgi:hypothetical protein
MDIHNNNQQFTIKKGAFDMEPFSRKRNIVWGGLLIIYGAMLLIENFLPLTAWIWVAVLAISGAGVFVVYLMDRSDWPMLLTAYVLEAVAGLILLVELGVLRDEAIAAYVLTAVALPFLYVYILNRDHRWALIPAYVLVAVGGLVFLIGVGLLHDLLIPAYIMFAIAIPFFFVYLSDKNNWWALIPGGIMGFIGLSFFIAGANAAVLIPVVLILVGLWLVIRQFTRN